jgi:MFS superfamily sulfate permease-like transporter
VDLPASLPKLNPEIAVIGLISLVILFGLPWIPYKAFRRIPGPMLVLVAAIPLGMAFDLEHKHAYLFPDQFFDTEHYKEYEVGPRFLVDMPEVIKQPNEAFAFPDFRGILTITGLQYIVLFSLIGSLESLLSAKAVELIDPYKRKTNFDRDLTAVGVANTVAAAIGGLPMISEIVRSKANIDNGARTRWANFFHGIFLLAFVLLLPNLIHRIPLAALGAMLVYTGFRLASPHEFVRTYKIGLAQLVIFLTTIVMTLATDLLIGIFSGVLVKFIMQYFAGVELRYTFRPALSVERPEGAPVRIRVRSAAVFSNWLSLKKSIRNEAANGDVVLDLSQSCLVDHTVMEKLHELERDFSIEGRHLEVIGLDEHRPVSPHPKAARKKPSARKLENVEA